MNLLERAFAWLNYAMAPMYGYQLGKTPAWWLRVHVLHRLCPPEGWPAGTVDTLTLTQVMPDQSLAPIESLATRCRHCGNPGGGCDVPGACG